MKKLITIILSIALLCTAAVACTCGTITMQERIALYELADTAKAELAVTINTAVYAETKGDYEVTLAIVKALYTTDEELSEDTLEAIADYLWCDCGGQTDEVVSTPTPTVQATKKATKKATATPTPTPTPKPCSHENVTYTKLDATSHTVTCSDCGVTVSTDAHSFVGGVCSLCRYVCVHEYEDGTCKYCGTICNHTAWHYSDLDATYCLRICDECNKIIRQNEYHSWERYNDTTFKCKKCGKLAYDNGSFKESDTTTKTCGCSATCTCPEGECKCQNCGCKNQQNNEQ